MGTKVPECGVNLPPALVLHCLTFANHKRETGGGEITSIQQHQSTQEGAEVVKPTVP